MTGYGEASAQVEGAHYFLEVRSLNNKYFKSSVRLPEEFQGLEAEIEQKLRERVTRGTVTVTARCSDASENAAYEINSKALSRYIEQIKGVATFASGELALDPAALLSLPGVLQPPANEEERFERARRAFLQLLQKAVDGLISMREHEGRGLVRELDSLREFIDQRLRKVIELSPGVVAEYEKRLKARIETMLRDANLALSPVDLIREIAVYAERTDIAEETQRLMAHLAQFRELLGASDSRPIGRTLDFLAQEMLRETNTIASKSPDATIARFAVEIKGAIDRIKEQAANVE
jgi:uncharacterized protein (TIGR00255 family)